MTTPLRPQASSGAEREQDLGEEIAVAILDLIPQLVDERGIVFEIAEPEPVLRGVASAYAALAQVLPGGLDEAQLLLGLLALELKDADQRRRTASHSRSNLPLEGSACCVTVPYGSTTGP